MLNAIFKTGAIPVFIDLDPDTFGSSPESIEIKITEKTKLIVAQHSFGIPCKIDKIVRIGKKYNIFVLEDSALSLDSSLSGVKVGNWGDAAIFSTDHSKPLNTLIGGLLYTKDEELYKKIKLYWEKIPQLTKDHQRRLFNQLVFERKYYNTSKYSLGRLLSSIKGKIPFVTNSNSFLEADYTKISSNDGRLYPYPAKIPIFLAKMGLYEMDRWNAEKEQRKELLNNFITLSKNLGINQYLPAAYFDSELEIVPHRFVYTHPDSEVIIKKMSKIIDVNWFWFKRPIIGCKDPSEFGYKYGSCPVSEKVGKGIINWPCVFNNSDNEQLLKYFKKVHK
jgi:dTDP-4-amino-4,6-dideoxygalactose transaminase